MLGQHCIKTYSSTQGIIAISSGEAEFYGIVKAASVGLGIQSMLNDLNCKCKLEILTDATAAQGMASRRGLGKPKHMDVQFLWIQERINRQDFTLAKVWGHVNPADLMTKHLDAKSIHKLMNIIGIHYLEGRSGLAPTLGSIKLPCSGELSNVSARLRPNSRRGIGAKGELPIATETVRSLGNINPCFRLRPISVTGSDGGVFEQSRPDRIPGAVADGRCPGSFSGQILPSPGAWRDGGMRARSLLELSRARGGVRETYAYYHSSPSVDSFIDS